MTTTDAPPILAGRTVDEIRTLLDDATDEQAVIIGEALALVRLEDDWRTWLTTLFPDYFGMDFGEHHRAFWNWLWAIDERAPRPFVGVWPRGGGKSSSAEAGVVALGALAKRRYVLWVCATQEQADKHVETVAGLLESKRFGEVYPDLSDRAVNKFGQAKGWRRNRLRCRSGFVIDAFGLDVAARGVKTDDARPDAMVFDDIDGQHDGPNEIERMIDDVTHKLIPAGADNLAVLAIQNLIHKDGVFARLVDGRADFLGGRILSGPVPAMHDLVTTERDGDTIILSGTASWVGQDAEVCQRFIDRWGVTAFMAEAQHDVSAPPGGMFDHVTFMRCTREEYDQAKLDGRIIDVAVCVDPAVTNTDRSDSQAVQVDAVGDDGTLYRVRSWEQRSSPLEAIKLALRWAIDEGATHLRVETDQGGDTWDSVYRQALDELRGEGIIHDLTVIPSFGQDKAGREAVSKTHRIARMLADYERANSRIVHVEGTHQILEAALRRFPRTKPYDLADACLVADTPVLTDRGWRRLDSMSIGDVVATRRGWGEVTAAGRTGIDRPVVRLVLDDGRSIVGTPTHPVWTLERGWTPMGECEALTVLSSPIWSIQYEYSTEAASGGATPTLDSERIGSTTRRAVLVGAMSSGTSIGRSTPTRTALSPRDTTCITSTTTPSITRRTTLSPSRAQPIAASTAPPSPANELTSSWPRSEPRPPNGTEVLRVEPGTWSMVDGRGKDASISVASARSAAPSSIPADLATVPASAQCRVATASTDDESAARLRRASSAAPSSPCVTLASPHALVPVCVRTVSPAGHADVWNLEVTPDPEYVAGVLVHNCYWAWHYFRPGGAHSAVSHAGAVAAAGSLPSRTEVFAMGRRR